MRSFSVAYFTQSSSLKFDREVEITAIEHDQAECPFLQLHAVQDIKRSNIHGSSRVDGGRNVHPHHAAHIVVIIWAERLSKRGVVLLIDFARRVTWIRDLIHSGIHSHV